ncbi:hypothetical protein C8A03DRAFT_37702 [Achaetomium macrosporum]|uniref:Uncharacterized protein n=1 Tax=Achaetomium macrosporum TaxID=79813 RepID=A0AAN7H7T9_9PEZI|nr:hypothetical protein C8A03DRAFT_37702 [Achaetomium macrosporum]
MSSKPAPTPTLTLYRGFPQQDRYTPSPFINKLETRLRIGGVAYSVGVGSPFTAPRGKMPLHRAPTRRRQPASRHKAGRLDA